MLGLGLFIPQTRLGGTPVAPAAPVNTALPVITGSPVEGQTLHATTGSWTGYPPPTYAYQWKSGASNVGTNSANYVIQNSDGGAVITVVVTATNGSGTASATSTATSAVTVLDSTPNVFSLGSVNNAPLASTISSTPFTVGGINTPAAISVTGGSYIVNSGTPSTDPGTVLNGDSVFVRGLSSASYSGITSVTLTIGGVSDTFTITSVAADVTPDPVSFAPITNAPLSSTQGSNEIQIFGLNTVADVSITGGLYSKNGGIFTSSSGTAVNGNRFVVSRVASSAYSTPMSATLTVGTLAIPFTVTTLADPTPHGFSLLKTDGFYIKQTDNNSTILLGDVVVTHYAGLLLTDGVSFLLTTDGA